ncbi:MAG: PDZ domain-containing protein [Planctomycetota bacterium]|jgi:C-terminal processing protease CtpA/Prc
MRATILALLLSLPLLAGDKAPLAKAVELFQSNDAARREAGSQLAAERLQELLAPLLEAMQHEDPEVRRRARRAILALVPGELEKEDLRNRPSRRQLPVQVQVRQQILQQLAQQLARRRELDAQEQAKRLALRNQARDNHGAALLARFGVTGKTRRRAPLQPGFLVQQVKPNSDAERLGLRVGDIIVNVNGRATSWPRDFARIRNWKRVRLLVLRGKEYHYLPPREARR